MMESAISIDFGRQRATENSVRATWNGDLDFTAPNGDFVCYDASGLWINSKVICSEPTNNEIIGAWTMYGMDRR